MRIRKGLSDYTVKTYLIFCKKFIRDIRKDIVPRHYSDFSPEVLKEIYDKANLRYFS